MTITELLLPILKTDPESASSFKEQAAEIFSHFAGVPGLQYFSRGTILFDNGEPVEPSSGRGVLILEWDTASSLHEFYPHSAAFQNFVSLVKPFIAAPESPQIFEAVTSAEVTASATFTQILKVRQGGDTEKLWGQLQEILVSNGKTAAPVFAHASGIENDEGTFLGMIGWRGLEDYERAQDETVRAILSELGAGGKILDLVVQLNQMAV
ncbi:hypothetical protein BJX99DRAFT_257758 [Aspergillus californicus]